MYYLGYRCLSFIKKDMEGSIMVKCNSLLCLFLVGLFVACAIPISAAAPISNDNIITVKSGSLFEIEEPALPQDTDNEFYTYRLVFDPNYFEAYLGGNGTAFKALKKPGQETIMVLIEKETFYGDYGHSIEIVDIIEYHINIIN